MRLVDKMVVINEDTFQPEMHVTLAFPMQLVREEDEDMVYDGKPAVIIKEESFFKDFYTVITASGDTSDD